MNDRLREAMTKEVTIGTVAAGTTMSRELLNTMFNDWLAGGTPGVWLDTEPKTKTTLFDKTTPHTLSVGTDAEAPDVTVTLPK